MKLIDLTKKKLVHKATVAAAKAPRLELGVLGISIGQQQSTGDTSKPALKWMNRGLNESQDGAAEDFIEVLEYLGSTMVRTRLTQTNGDPLPADFDLDGLVKDAMKVYAHERTGDTAAEAISHYVNLMWHATNMQNNMNHAAENMGGIMDKLKEMDQHHVVSERMQRMYDSVVQLAKDTNYLRLYKDLFSRVTLQLDNVMRAAHGMQVYNRDMEPSQVKIAQAYLKIHGIPMVKPEN